METVERAPSAAWDHLVAGDIAPGVEAAIRAANALVDEAVALPADADVDAVLGRLDGASRVIGLAYGQYAIQDRLNPDPAVREAATAAGPAIEGWRRTIAERDGVAELIRATAARRDSLDPGRRALLDRWARDVRETGQPLDPEGRRRLAELRTVDLEGPGRFFPALGRPVTIDIAGDELDGVPASVLALLGPGDDTGRRAVALTDPIVNGLLETAPNRDLRERVARGNLRRGYPQTTQILDEVATARRATARLLGEASWMAFRAPRLAIGGEEAVGRFFGEIQPALTRRSASELAAMQALLAEETGDPNVVVEEWDWRYLDARQRAREGVDPAALRDYLPFEAVLDGLWRLSDQVFGVRVEPRPDRRGWHPDVRAYDMVDSATGALIAGLFVDPYVRAGKAGSAWADVLDPGDADRASGRPPVLLLAMNAPAPGDRPSTLGFIEIDVTFHEYGHVLDFALDSSPWFPLRDDWLQFDWVEAPSTFLGRWGQHPDVMRTFARHVETGEPVPDAMFDALLRLEDVNAGLRSIRYLSMGVLDMLLHGTEPIAALDADRQAWSLRGIPYVEDASFVGIFLHMIAGYSAATYGFVWDWALRDDLFAGFGPDLLSPASGARYRQAILEAPWTQHPLERMAAFLGRPWSTKAFLERSGS